MTLHYPELGGASELLTQISRAARPIRSATQIWVMTHNQYGISALVSQTTFLGEPSSGVAQRRLFSQDNLCGCKFSGRVAYFTLLEGSFTL